MEFEDLLQSVLHNAANPEPTNNMEQRMLRACTAPSVDAIASVQTNPQPATAFHPALAEESVFLSLWRSLRELLSPRPLPPLVLESRPIPVTDKMASEQGYSSAAYAFAIHAFAVFLIGFVVRAQIRDADPIRIVTPLTDPPVLRIVARASSQMGGGGGQHGETPVSRGHLPRLEQQQIVPPKAPPLIPPKIAIEPSIVVQQNLKLADNVMPNVGMPNSPLAGVSMGDGRGTGIGPGNGAGIGPGTGGNTGNGLPHRGGSVSAPQLLNFVEPEFTEEARKAKLSGDVNVYLWVDEHGNPSHVHVIRGIGMGLDERAVEAVKQYKFRPAMDNGMPVTVEMYIVVNFQIM
jgi:protein TonB